MTPEATGADVVDVEADPLADTGPDAPADALPDDTMLPFHVVRVPEGEPLAAADIAATTEAVLALWHDTRHFRWLLDTGHGMADGNEWGLPGYKVWSQDTVAIRSGDSVTFRHVGGGDNNLLRHSRVLGYVLAGHLATGDATLKEVSLQYLRGLQAMYTGMIWPREDPPIDTIMARAVWPRNHAYVTSTGRKAYADYEPAQVDERERRHDVFRNPGNPAWGDVWVRTKRSKDDLPFLYRNVPIRMRVVARDPDPEVAAEAARTLEYVRGFCRDIVDHQYRIRTKDPDGVPTEILWDGIPDEFACYTAYDEIDPNSECSAKLAISPARRVLSMMSSFRGTAGMEAVEGGDQPVEVVRRGDAAVRVRRVDGRQVPVGDVGLGRVAVGIRVVPQVPEEDVRPALVRRRGRASASREAHRDHRDQDRPSNRRTHRTLPQDRGSAPVCRAQNGMV